MCNLNFTPFPDITTERLILRQMKPEDEDEIFRIKSDERISKYLDRRKAGSIEDARKFIANINDGIIRNEWILWAITLKNEDRLIGTICLWNISREYAKAEVGYELMPDFQGRGIMQESLKAVIDYGFKEMKLRSIEAYTRPDNLNSIKLLKRNHFIKKENFKENSSTGGEAFDMEVYSIDFKE